MSNLETTRHGRNLQERLHVVLRLFDGDLAARLRRTFSLPLTFGFGWTTPLIWSTYAKQTESLPEL